VTELARMVDGVVAVHADLTFEHDDLDQSAAANRTPG
jgi:hypothetical protein